MSDYPMLISNKLHSFRNFHYLNSGDWVESMTALVEDEQGEWDIVTYNNVQLYADAV